MCECPIQVYNAVIPFGWLYYYCSTGGQNYAVPSRLTAGPARNEAVTATTLKSKIDPKAGVKLPVCWKRKPISGGPNMTVGIEITLTSACPIPLLTPRR